MDFKLREGPWNKLFQGNYQGFEVEIHSNPESVLIVTVLERKKEKIEGAVIELFKVFAVEGELEDFVDTFPREAMVLIKHEPKSSLKYFLVSSTPSYAKYKEEEFCNETEKLLKKLKESARTIKDVSRAYDLSLTELHEAGEKFRAAFFSQPLMAPLITPTAREETGYEPIDLSERKRIGKGEVILGVTRGNVVVKEPLELLCRTTIFGSTTLDRKHAIHIIAEGGLISNVAVVLFDWDESFNGLNTPSNDLASLQKYKVNFEPIGFPIRDFKAMDLKVDLNLISVSGTMELFGVRGEEEAKFITSLIKEGKVDSIEELAKRARKSQLLDESKAGVKNRTIRILRLIDLRHPKLFGGKNEINEISKNWAKAIGRAGIIHLEGIERRAATLLIHNLLKGIFLHYDAMRKTKGVNALILLPEIKIILSAENPSLMEKEIMELLKKFKEVGVCFALSSDRPGDLLREVITLSETEIFILSRADVGVRMSRSKQYRIMMRPGLSQCTEK
ncbi:MAG: hypothetical protein ABIE23_03970 [archaeon]|nr:hypothetical protein [Candidatus Micrarchaeota archaeon]